MCLLGQQQYLSNVFCISKEWFTCHTEKSQKLTTGNVSFARPVLLKERRMSHAATNPG